MNKIIYKLTIFVLAISFTTHTAFAVGNYWVLNSAASHPVEASWGGFYTFFPNYSGLPEYVCYVTDPDNMFGCLSSSWDPYLPLQSICVYWDPYNTAWSAFPDTMPNVDYPIYTFADPACAGPMTVKNLNFSKKEATCPPGEVMTGTRFYEHSPGIDEEHQDAICAPLSGVTFGNSRWVDGLNAWNNIRGYKDSLCSTEEVMTGIRLVMIPTGIDDEHVDSRCTQVTGINVAEGARRWVSAPNAFVNEYPAYKTAQCATGEIMVGARWYQFQSNLDDEHTDAYCLKLKPELHVWFSQLLEKVKNHFTS